MNDGSTTETAMVGKREVAGINAFFDVSETTQTEYIVQVAGKAIKANAQALREEFERNKELRDLILRYTQVLIAQISQTAGCNRLHPLEQRLARWPLEVQDRVDSDDLKLTQEFTPICWVYVALGSPKPPKSFKKKVLSSIVAVSSRFLINRN
jgi:hypothetical protein